MLVLEQLNFLLNQARYDADRLADFFLRIELAHLAYCHASRTIEALDIVPTCHMVATIAGDCTDRSCRQYDFTSGWHDAQRGVNKDVSKAHGRVS